MRTLYEILNVETDANQSAIKKAYRAMASKFHPDKNADDPTTTAKFQEIQRAYEVLSDVNKRARYDETGHENEGPGKEEIVTNMISKFILDCATQNNYKPGDYVTAARKMIQGKLSTQTIQLRKLEVAVKRLTYIIENTTVPDAIAVIFKLNLSQLDDNRDSIKWNIELFTHALEIMDQCEYIGERENETRDNGRFPWEGISEPHI